MSKQSPYSREGEEAENTDRELWREREGDYYSDRLFVTKGGGIGMDCGGNVKVRPVRAWHEMDATIAEQAERIATLEAELTRSNGRPDYQGRVRDWTKECFGDAIDLDKKTRQAQFFEEAIEVVQAAGLDITTAHGLIDLAYSKDAGNVRDEVGDVMTSLAAFCTAHGVVLHESAEEALRRCIANTDKIRMKQRTKPHHKQVTEVSDV
jgi:NTP pyrophosphatase (non-canonical NTP hydrolase)